MRNLRFIFSALVLCLFLGLSANTSTAASSNVSIYIDGENQPYSNLAIIEKGTTLVPLRGIFESLDASVAWDQRTKTVHASKENTKIQLKIGSMNTKVNGETVKISVPAKIKDGRTLVPLRFISESLGAKVGWDNATKKVTITSKQPAGTVPSVIKIQ